MVQAQVAGGVRPNPIPDADPNPSPSPDPNQVQAQVAGGVGAQVCRTGPEPQTSTGPQAGLLLTRASLALDSRALQQRVESLQAELLEAEGQVRVLREKLLLH